MHEEWRDTQRTASTEVQLTGAEDLAVTKRQAGAALSWKAWYRPYRVEVLSSWPNAKIGNGGTLVHLYCNEVMYSGALGTSKVLVYLTDLDEVPEWLVTLVREAERRNYG